MPLNSIALKADIKQIFKNAFDNSASTDPDAALNQVAEQLANRIVEEIGNLTLTIPSGLVVVSGTAVTQTNPAPIVVTNGVT